MSAYFDTVMSHTAAVLKANGMSHIIHAGGMNVSRGVKSMRIRDIAGVVTDFEALRTRPDLVADALAAHAMDEIGIKHSIPSVGLTIKIKTPKSTIPVSLSSYRPMNMLRCR